MTPPTPEKSEWQAGKSNRGIFYKTRGEKSSLPPLLLIMGYSGNRESWNADFIDELAADYFLILVDNRGTGESGIPESAETCTVADMALDIASVLDALALSRSYIVGYSLGGTIALQFALDNPKRVSGLMVLSSTLGIPYYVPPSPEIWEQISNPPGETVLEKTESIWKACLPLAKYEGYRPALLQIYERSSQYPISRRVMAWQLKAYRAFHFAAENWRPSFKLFIVHGELDRLTPVANSTQMAGVLVTSQLHIIKNCEHMPHLERRNELLELIGELCAP